MAMAASANADSTRLAPVAFHYAAVFAPRDLAWYTRFEMLVTGAILSGEQSKRLRVNGTKLVAYEWIAGYYPNDLASAPMPWQREVAAKEHDWTLTPAPIGGGSAEKDKTAHWYDFGSDQLLAARAASLASRLSAAGYHGYFFDTPGFEHLPAAAQEAFKRRHPGMDYNERLGRFLAALRQALPEGKIIFTNQGYRHAAHLLAHADIDLSESSFTSLEPNGSTRFRPWHDVKKPWESVRTPMYDLILPALRKYPKVQMVHVNYAGGSAAEIRRAHRYSHVYATILGHRSYLIVPRAPASEEDQVYFADLGQPLDYWHEDSYGVVWRRFERGVAAINSCERPAAIPSLGLSLPEPLQGYVFPGKQ